MREIFRFIIRFVRPYKRKLLLIFAVILITTYIVAMYPYLYGKMVDSLFYQKEISEFLHYIGIYFLLFFVNQCLHFILDMTTVRTRTSLQADVKRFIFSKILSFKGQNLTNLKSGDVIFRMNRDSDEFMSLIYSDFFYGISAAFDFILCILITAFISVPLAFVSLILAIITFCLSKYFSNLVKKVRKEAVVYLAENQSWLLELLQCMRDVRLMTATKAVVNKYLKKDILAVRLGIKQAKYETLSDRSNIAMQVLSTICLYAVSAVFITGGSLTLGGLVACIDYFERIVLMLNRISKRFLTIPNRLIAIERVMAVEEEKIEEYNSHLPEHLIKSGEIHIRNIYFAYEDKKYVINNLSLDIAPGEQIALVGKSGEGKSTIVHLLCRLYDIESGEITIDGVPIKNYNLHDLRSQVGIAYQDTVLFENTIRYNLIFSNSRERDAEIWAVLENIKFSDFVHGLPDGLDTRIISTERSLSGGQKQRIAIARLLLKNARIIIFDESTSSLDREAEQTVLNSWRELLKGRTIIMIAHRLDTVISADRVACLENGKIVGCDKHENLLKNCMTYKRLFYEQYETKMDKVKENGNESKKL